MAANILVALLLLASCASLSGAPSQLNDSGSLKPLLSPDSHAQGLGGTATGANVSAPVNRRYKRDAYLSQVYRTEDVTTEEIEGEPIAISNWQHCETEECTVSQTFSHTISVTSTTGIGFGLNPSQVFSLSAHFDLSRAVAEGKTTTYSFKLDSPGVGRLMFTPRMKIIRGSLIKDARAYCGGIISCSIISLGLCSLAEDMPGVNCFGNHQDHTRFELKAPIRDANAVGDQVQGTWWVDYKPDPKPVDDVNFYIIRNRDLPGQLDSDHLRSGSPLMCAKSAMKRGENFAVWRAGTCYMKKTENGVGFLTDKFAKPIGYYNLPNPNSQSSASPRDRDQWVREGACDLIQEYKGYGYFCKSFSDSPDTVMMFRKSAKFLGAAGEVSHSRATFHPS